MASKETTESILTGCRGTCGFAPTVIVHGIGQSELYALDEQGNRRLNANGKPVTAWPPQADGKNLATTLRKPLIKTILTQKDNGFSDKVSAAIAEMFAPAAIGPDGSPVNGVELVRYPRSVARCTQEEKDFIYSCVHLEAFAQAAGEDHLYYFAYSSIGNNLAIAGELYEFIQQVKRETGHRKINLAPISLGATIANSLLEFYPQVYDDLNRVIYVVPALDGSLIAGDIYTGNLGFGGESLYKDLFPSLASGYTGYLMNILLRLLPKAAVRAVLEKSYEAVMRTVLVNCTVLWALVPASLYQPAAEKWLLGPAQSEIKRQTDLYHRASLHSRANIQKLVDRGIRVFDIVDYNYPLYRIADSWKTCNADGVIHLDSTSMGAVSGLTDTPLPEGYTPQNTRCSDPSHNHRSPDGIVDASAGLLPDNTFYFRNQHHERTGRNGDILQLITELLLNNEFTSVYSMPERFPQFNTADASNRRPPSNKTKDKLLTAVFRSVSDFLYKHRGPRGFFDSKKALRIEWPVPLPDSQKSPDNLPAVKQ